jgi:ferredoxin, 2Fe-2S
MDRAITVRAVDREGRAMLVFGRSGRSLMEALRAAGLDIAAVCGGVVACATCHVYLAPDWVGRAGARGADEEALLGCLDAFDPARSRLSCQIVLTPELEGVEAALAPED